MAVYSEHSLCLAVFTNFCSLWQFTVNILFVLQFLQLSVLCGVYSENFFVLKFLQFSVCNVQ